METTKYFTIDGSKKVAYKEWLTDAVLGSTSAGHILVCLPSLGDIKEEYRKLVPLLMSVFQRIIICDLRGMGESDVGFSSYSPLDTGKDIKTLLQSLNLTKVVLFGCSMSAASVLHATQAASSRVVGTILCSPFAWDHDMPTCVPTLLNVLLNTCTGPGFWVTYFKGLFIKPDRVDDLESYCIGLKRNLGEAGRMDALRGHVFGSKAPCVPDFRELHGKPISLIFGSKDPDFPSIDKEIAEFAVKLPNTAGKAVVIEDVGHYPMCEKPQEVADAITAFVRAIPLT